MKNKYPLHVLFALAALHSSAAWADEDPFANKPTVVASQKGGAAKPTPSPENGTDADLARKMLINAGVMPSEGEANSGFQAGVYGEQTGSVATPDMVRRFEAATGIEARGRQGKPQVVTTPSAELPGMQKAQGRPLVVKSMPGVNDLVNVSSSLPNRIATPFKNPQVVDMSKSATTVSGGDVFILPKGDKPIGVFIKDDIPNSPVVSLTLVPKESIPGQNILVTVDGYENLGGKDAERKEVREAGEYTDYIRFIMRSVAKNAAPEGFVTEKMKEPKAVSGNLEAVADTHYAGSLMDIYKYRIRNVGNEPITLSEQSFYTKGVRAVSLFPRLLLQYGQETSVFIARSKPGVMDEVGK